jgi:trk system potassium uptake protein TrkA
MRIVIVGATALGVATARKLIEAGHEVVVIDRSRERLDQSCADLDCGMIEGDGTLPSTLRNAYGDGADALLPLTNHDEDNVLAALVGRSIGFDRVVPKIVNHELGAICVELGLDDAIFADESIASTLMESLQDKAAIDSELAVGADLRVLRVRADADMDRAPEMPSGARLIAVLRGDEARFPDDGAPDIAEGDGLLLVAHERAVSEVRQRFGDLAPLHADAGGD